MFKSLKNLFAGNAEETNVAIHSSAEISAAAEIASDLFLRRESVFDTHNRPAGHLLGLQQATGKTLSPRLPHQIKDRLLLDLLQGQMADWKGGMAYIPLAASSLTPAAVHGLKPEKTVFLLTLDEHTNEETLTTHVGALQDIGFHIGIFRAPQHPVFSAAMALADLAVISVNQAEAAAIRDFSAAMRASDGTHKKQLLALNIDSDDEHRLCLQWHYTLFHGRFAGAATRPPEASGGDPHKVLLLNLLRLIQGDAENDEIADAVKQDPLLAFRVLRYLNSPALGLSRRIDSLPQALIILGRQRLTRWVAILLFSVREPNLGDWLLVDNALTRGRLLELLGEQLLHGYSGDALFLTGIFSCLDRLVRRPIAEILADIPLADEIRQALLQHEGPYAPLLAIAKACEAFDLPRMQSLAENMGLSSEVLNRALLAATAWASEVTEHWE